MPPHNYAFIQNSPACFGGFHSTIITTGRAGGMRKAPLVPFTSRAYRLIKLFFTCMPCLTTANAVMCALGTSHYAGEALRCCGTGLLEPSALPVVSLTNKKQFPETETAFYIPTAHWNTTAICRPALHCLHSSALSPGRSGRCDSDPRLHNP